MPNQIGASHHTVGCDKSDCWPAPELRDTTAQPSPVMQQASPYSFVIRDYQGAQ
jgi:hypothetical protein